MFSDLKHCRIDCGGAILTVTIARCEDRNTLNAAANQELSHVFDAFVADDSLEIAVLTGEGDDFFCAGVDPLDSGAPLPETGFAGLTARYDNPKPVIASVNGAALGMGFDLALACDLILAAETASFAFDTIRSGAVGLQNGAQRIFRQMPLKKAVGALLTGREISAPEGVMLGFVNDLFPRGHASQAARHLAMQIMECSPKSIRAVKQLAMMGLDQPTLRDAIAKKYPAVEELLASDEYQEGLRAFAEKRIPDWRRPT